MGSLQIQDTFEPYYAGRDAADVERQTGVEGNAPYGPVTEQTGIHRRGKLERTSRRLAMLARRQASREN